jgi:hypothetical protein
MYLALSKSLRVVALLLMLPCGGCGLSLLANDTAGTSTMPAEFVPPKEPTLVLVENYRSAAAGDADSDRLASLIGQELKDNKVAPLVDVAALADLRDRDLDAYRKMSVADIGRAVGAKQVVYVNVYDYSTEAPIAGDMVKWKASVKVKIVDSQTGALRWPQDLADGDPVNAETNYKEVDPEKGDILVRDQMNKLLAQKIGNLFHDWQKDADDGSDYGQQ